MQNHNNIVCTDLYIDSLAHCCNSMRGFLTWAKQSFSRVLVLYPPACFSFPSWTIQIKLPFRLSLGQKYPSLGAANKTQNPRMKSIPKFTQHKVSFTSSQAFLLGAFAIPSLPVQGLFQASLPGATPLAQDLPCRSLFSLSADSVTVS